MNSHIAAQAVEHDKRMDSRLHPAADTPDGPLVAGTRSAEATLASIIESARKISVLAEEVLRETVMNGQAAQKNNVLVSSPEIAIRLLTATEQQLFSLLAMLRKD